jgi:hypothetical protein
MLEKLPHAIGRALKGVHPGLDKTLFYSAEFADMPNTITLESPVFENSGALHQRFTEDGAKLSPPLKWHGVPAAARSLVLVIEDADSPTPAPIVHALVLDIIPSGGELTEGALNHPESSAIGYTLGNNTFFKAAYLPPDPPPGGGSHRYVFQIYALDTATGLSAGDGRGAVKAAMKGHVIAKGILIGTYERP